MYSIWAAMSQMKKKNAVLYRSISFAEIYDWDKKNHTPI